MNRPGSNDVVHLFRFASTDDRAGDGGVAQGPRDGNGSGRISPIALNLSGQSAMRSIRGGTSMGQSGSSLSPKHLGLERAPYRSQRCGTG